MSAGSILAAPSSILEKTSNNAALQAVANTGLGQPSVMSWGRTLTASIDAPIRSTDTTLTGTASAGAQVSVNYNDGTEHTLTGVADASGQWAISVPEDAPLPAGATLNLGAFEDYRWATYPAIALVMTDTAPPPTTPIVYDDKSCSICHYSYVQAEHRTQGGCSSCHCCLTGSITNYVKAASYAGYPYSGATRKTCGVTDNACHGTSAATERQWHGDKAAETSAAHAVTLGALPIAGDTNTSCGGYSGGASCHDSLSTQSNFYFGAMDVASAHADYYHAATENLTSPGVPISSAITASASACGICHDKSSTSADKLKPTVAATVSAAKGAGTYSCRTCHREATTYVEASAYSSSLRALYPQSMCFKTPYATGTGIETSFGDPATLSNINQIINKLSPDLQAQLKGVTGVQSQLEAGSITETVTGIPASALPATSLSTKNLF
jgi:hypothetical protein